MKTTMCQMKNVLGGINGRSTIAEEKSSKFEDGTIENIQNEKQNRKNYLNKQSISELWRHLSLM